MGESRKNGLLPPPASLSSISDSLPSEPNNQKNPLPSQETQTDAVGLPIGKRRKTKKGGSLKRSPQSIWGYWGVTYGERAENIVLDNLFDCFAVLGEFVEIRRPSNRRHHDCDAYVRFKDGRILFVEVKSTVNTEKKMKRMGDYIRKIVKKNISPFIVLLLSWDKNRIFIFTKDGFRGELNPKTLKKVLEEVME
ncbi:MAG: hypothetical protein QXG08_03175 [Candidatus Methanomethyliaceae archaeon]